MTVRYQAALRSDLCVERVSLERSSMLSHRLFCVKQASADCPIIKRLAFGFGSNAKIPRFQHLALSSLGQKVCLSRTQTASSCRFLCNKLGAV